MINLLPLDVRVERRYGRLNRIIIGYVIALSITALLVAIVMLGSLKFFGTDESAIKKEIADNTAIMTSLQSKTTDLNNTVARLEVANKLHESGVNFSELIPKIGSILPEGTVLNGLSLTEGSTEALNLDVDLERPELAATLVRNLIDSEIFEAADIGAIIPKISEGSRYQYGTSVSVSFTGSAEAKEKEKKAAAAAKAAADAAAESAGGN
jgi:hypothetical protein